MGIRHSVGQDFTPKDGTLWFTDNQTDGMGDGIPPGELNRITKMGQDFGYPFWNGHVKVAGSAAAPDLKNLPEPAGAVFPQIEFPAHQAQLGMTFYTGKMFPPAYQNTMFIAMHGSWNKTNKQGYNVMQVSLDAKGVPTMKPFLEGFLTDPKADPPMWGRPVDVLVMKDGALLVSDDYNGIVYRISYAQ